MKDKQIHFLAKVMQIMQAEDITLEQVTDKAPYGFWSKVEKATGKAAAACNVDWNRHKAEYLAYVADQMGSSTTIAKVVQVVKPVEPATAAPIPKECKVAKVDTFTREEVRQMMQELEARLTTLLGDKVGKGVRVEGATAFEEENRPPKPPKTGKMFHGHKQDVRGRVDDTLFRLLQADCDKHFNGNMSAMLDYVLWHFYGKPRLSFEQE